MRSSIHFLARFLVLLDAIMSGAQAVASAAPASPVFALDPATVQRFGAGFRYAQEGWIVLHLEGGPYERGLQHGRLLAPEIAAYLRCYAKMQSPAAATDGWKLTRTLVNTSFLRGFDREYLEEMKGIADGASAAGARFDDRAIDLLDIAALNLWPELMSLDDANSATPTGLEGIDFPSASPSPAKPATEGHCSAFAATGKATRDGHPVIGHITMFDLYPSRWYNIWVDIKSDQGHRITMQTYPAGIYSGMDYYLNDAGICLVETTIDQTRFNGAGTPLASRVRQAMQYGDSIESVTRMLQEHNNGLYNNEWLLADMKTDEIAMFELATQAGRLWRSSRGEWYGGTEGFYWGCNNAKDLAVRLETIPAANDRPANLVWHPADRDLKWLQLYQGNVGRMDEAFARKAFTTAPLCSSYSLDAKFTTAALAREMNSWAFFGPPLERAWLPQPEEREKFNDVRPLVSNSWTILGRAVGQPPAGAGNLIAAPVDLHDPVGEHVLAGLFGAGKDKDKDDVPPTKPAWHGTILPANDADLWLASSFAEYERMVSLERGYAEAQSTKCLCMADYDKVAPALFAARARYFAGVRLGGDVPLTKIHAAPASAAWYKIASGKGVLVLAELRRLMGEAAFTGMMDQFGRGHAGKAATSAEFAAHAARCAGRDLAPFFKYWLQGTGLPKLELTSALAKDDTVRGQIQATAGPLPANIEMTLEYADGELTQVVALTGEGKFEAKAPKTVTRLIVDKYARMARANGSEASLGSFSDDPERTLIVYGTRDDAAANREAAEICQKSIRAGWHNIDLPIKSDVSVTENELANHHLILIGRPAANAVAARLQRAFPAAFGPASFVVRGQTYANMDSALLAAGVNPLGPRYSLALIAGNSAAATFAHAGELAGRGTRSELLIFDPSAKPKSLVAPAPELVKAFEGEKLAAQTPGR